MQGMEAEEKGEEEDTPKRAVGEEKKDEGALLSFQTFLNIFSLIVRMKATCI